VEEGKEEVAMVAHEGGLHGGAGCGSDTKKTGRIGFCILIITKGTSIYREEV
jgi:hypothetical protein